MSHNIIFFSGAITFLGNSSTTLRDFIVILLIIGCHVHTAKQFVRYMAEDRPGPTTRACTLPSIS